jgi:hypothetical protein
MKTSYFSNIRNIKVPLSISQHPPKWYVGAQFKVLAPPWSLVEMAHKGLSKEVYTNEFKRVVLAHLDPREVYDAIVDEYSNEVTLMCFEKIENPGDFCHRRIVADWFEEHLKIEVPEWTAPPKIRSTLSF